MRVSSFDLSRFGSNASKLTFRLSSLPSLTQSRWWMEICSTSWLRSLRCKFRLVCSFVVVVESDRFLFFQLATRSSSVRWDPGSSSSLPSLILSALSSKLTRIVFDRLSSSSPAISSRFVSRRLFLLPSFLLLETWLLTFVCFFGTIQLPPVAKGEPKFAFEARMWKESIHRTVNLTQVSSTLLSLPSISSLESDAASLSLSLHT